MNINKTTFLFVFTFSTLLCAQELPYGNNKFYPHSLKQAIDYDLSLPSKPPPVPDNLISTIQSGNIDTVDKVTESTILHDIASIGDPVSARVLLKRGAQVNVVNRYGAIPLHNAVQSESEPTVRAFLNAGADVDARLILGQNHWLTPLGMAIELGHIGIVRLLIRNGARLEAISSGYDISLKSKVSYSALNLSVFYGHIELIEILLNEMNVDVHARDSRGDTALHTLALSYHLTPELQLEIAHLLIEAGADVDARNDHFATRTYSYLNIQTKRIETRTTKEHKATPLHRVSRHGSPELLNFLISKEADVNARTSNGLTPLYFTVARNIHPAQLIYFETSSLPMVRSLLKAGADPAIKVQLEISHRLFPLITTTRNLTPASLAVGLRRLDIAAFIKSYSVLRSCYGD